jgi:nicotinamidase-related amidase
VAPTEVGGGPAVLLLIDVVNPLDFAGAAPLLRRARPMMRRVAELQRRARRAGIPTVYVNDNFGAWHLGFRELVQELRKSRKPGRALLEAITPDAREDYFVLKPMHSGFFCTPLEVLLRRLGAKTLILAGLAADICILFTAADAHMRGYGLVVPSDCVASEREPERRRALDYMRRVLGADVRPGRALRFRGGRGGGRVAPAARRRSAG